MQGRGTEAMRLEYLVNMFTCHSVPTYWRSSTFITQIQDEFHIQIHYLVYIIII